MDIGRTIWEADLYAKGRHLNKVNLVQRKWFIIIAVLILVWLFFPRHFLRQEQMLKHGRELTEIYMQTIFYNHSLSKEEVIELHNRVYYRHGGHPDAVYNNYRWQNRGVVEILSIENESVDRTIWGFRYIADVEILVFRTGVPQDHMIYRVNYFARRDWWHFKLNTGGISLVEFFMRDGKPVD